MIFDVGALEVVVLIILGMLLFGPEKLPKVIQDFAAFIRKVRDFSDSARDDIRKEMGPEYKDFEFQDLHPKRFAQKHLLDKGDEFGVKELRELKESFDFRQELSDVSDAVNIHKGGGDSSSPPELLKKPDTASSSSVSEAASSTPNLTKSPDLSKPVNGSQAASAPPFDPDAT